MSIIHKFGPIILIAVMLLLLRQVHMLPFSGSQEGFEIYPERGQEGFEIYPKRGQEGFKMIPDGRWRKHKMPNYYGWGPSSPYYYGEPYYARSVKY